MSRSLVRLPVACTVGLLALLLAPAAALGIEEWPTPTGSSAPAEITVGPDNALWFTESFGGNIGRLDPSNPAAMTEYPIPWDPATDLPPGPQGITVGPDNAVWFTEEAAQAIGRIDPLTKNIVEYPLPPVPLGQPVPAPDGITKGPDGALWFTENGAGKIGRIHPSNPGQIDEFPRPSDPPVSIGGPSDIVAVGNALWFTESLDNQIGRIDATTKAITEYPLPQPGSEPNGLTIGPDGALWFTQTFGARIGRIDPSNPGQIDEFPVTPGSGPGSIVAGPFDSLWFTESDLDQISGITMSGRVRRFIVPTHPAEPDGITLGPDGALWFTELSGDKIGRLVPPPPAAAVTVDFPQPPLPALASTTPPAKPKRCRVPKLRGSSVARAKKKLRRAGCRYRIRGKGRVVSTSPRAGTRTSKRVQVKAKPKRRR